MEQYAEIDVSLDSASVCFVNAQGKIVKEARVACEPEALIAWLAAHGTPMARIWPGGRAFVAVALCRDEGGRAGDGVARDASRARRF